MIITSKLVVRTLVVLIGLSIFVRGIWINFISNAEMSTLDTINACLSFIVAGITVIILILFSIVVFFETIVPFIKNLWNGEIQLFKPFKINFKFKK